MVLIDTVEAARMLDVATETVSYHRRTGRLKPRRRHPFMFLLADVEGLKAEMASRGKRGPKRTAITLRWEPRHEHERSEHHRGGRGGSLARRRPGVAGAPLEFA